MLDAKTIATVKSTLPLLTKTCPALTAHFYQRMFSHNPELKDIFNMSNQRNGDQREALFNAICAYAAIAKRHYFDNSQLCFFAAYQGIGCNHF